MIVVDANVVAHFFIEGGKTALARRVRERDSQWIVPGIWRHEFLNILVSSCLFAKMPLETAHRIWGDADDMLRGGIYEPSMKDVLAAAVERSTTAYDAEYVTLAMAHGVRCVTEDLDLQKAFPEVAASMAAFVGAGESPRAVREAPALYGTRRGSERRKRGKRE